MIINVTKEHIAKGQPDNWEECPIALALLEISPRRLNVEHNCVSISGRAFNKPENKIVDLPPEALKFVADFDDGPPVDEDFEPVFSKEEYFKPFSFHLSAECFML